MRRLLPLALLLPLMLVPGTSGAAAPAAPAASSATIPVPEQDPFYKVPTNVGTYRNGQVISSRVVNASMFEIPLPARAWQVKYRTENSKGRPSATVTTLLVPKAAWAGNGARPLVSYQTAEDGVAGRCAPSYALRAGLDGGFTGSYSETPLIAMALARGWAVSVPDYEGPRSEFLVAGTQARGVIDGVRAARNFGPAGISTSAPIGLWGYSGGSLASVTAAQLQPTYAPRLRLRALALGGLLGSIRATIDAFSGSFAGGAIPMGINGFLRAYPELDLAQYLSPSGMAKVKESSADCIFEAVPRYPFLTLSAIEAVPDALSLPPVARMLNANSPLHMAGIPRVPIYHYHARLDELAPIGPARATMRRFCAHGAVVQSKEKLLGEHLTEIVLGAPGALQFLSDRFAGKPPKSTCSSIPH